MSESLDPVALQTTAAPQEGSAATGSLATAEAASAQETPALGTPTAVENDPAAVEAGPVSTELPAPADGSATMPVGIPVSADEPTNATTPLDQALTDLSAAFDTYLSQLIGELTTGLQLGDPSPPTGNGSACDKFLATYNTLRGVTPAVDAEI